MVKKKKELKSLNQTQPGLEPEHQVRHNIQYLIPRIISE